MTTIEEAATTPPRSPVARAWRFTKLMFRAFAEDNTFDLGAALAYYTIFSIVPLLVVVISVSGLVAGPDAIRGQVFAQLHGLVGNETASALQDMLGEAYLSGKGVFATIVGLVTLVIGATGIFNALKNALDRMWEIQPRPKSTVLGFLFSRLVSLSFVMGLGFLLVITFTLNSLITGFADDLGRLLPSLGSVVVQGISWALMFSVSTFVFACLFKFLPDVRIGWRDVVPGAIFTTVLFALGKFLLDFYFDSADPTSVFGAAGGLISLLLWTYYSSQTFFLGAEFVYVWCQEKGRPIRPGADAVRVIRQEVVMEHGKVVEENTKRGALDNVRDGG
ncbi:MAG: YihY/virulence factor BrkB family protein [Flavobacteriales bacterium]|nr:YihY/virulence factor BrkB family protein [Flavobacteriales bacterium]